LNNRQQQDGVVKKASGPRYSASKLPPVPPPEPVNTTRKNPIHSVLTALPVIMLVAGLYFYYQWYQWACSRNSHWWAAYCPTIGIEQGRSGADRYCAQG